MSAHPFIVPYHPTEIFLVLLVAGMGGFPTIPATRKTKDLSHYDLAFGPCELRVEKDGANLIHGDATFAAIPPKSPR